MPENLENLELSLVLSDGTELAALELNGNTYISHDMSIDELTFEFNTSKVTTVLKNDDGETVHEVEEENMTLCGFRKYEDRIEFNLRQLTDFELYQIKTSGDIAYLAMMQDVEM